MPKRILILNAQGGTFDAELNAALAQAILKQSDGQWSPAVITLREADAVTVRQQGPSVDVIGSFQVFQDRYSIDDLDAAALRLTHDYPSVDWWAVVASERSFIDASFLVGGLGHRVESRQYVEQLLVNLVSFFEGAFSSNEFAASICQLADSLVTHVFYQVARKFGVRVVVLSPPAWLRENGKPGLFLARDEFRHCDQTERMYRELHTRELSEQERERVQRFRQTVVGFDMARTYENITKRPFAATAFSPNLKRLGQYLSENAQRRKNVEYYKIDVLAKTKANIVRAWRKWRIRNLLGPETMNFSPRSVFFPLHYQPEQTTLVGGIYFANQVGVLENIAKALPFGYSLIVKEHPRGRGARPAWQYTHLAHFPNIEFCDADTKDILRRCEAAVTIAGTIGLEALAMDKPVILLGQCQYDFVDVVYRAESWPDLARIFRRILIDRDYERNSARHRVIDRFFLAFLATQVPVPRNKESADTIAAAICEELGVHECKIAAAPATATAPELAQ
jgi:hypothetical protein